MKKDYLEPEFDLMLFSFEDILSEKFNVSTGESGNDDHKDDDETEW